MVRRILLGVLSLAVVLSGLAVLAGPAQADEAPGVYDLALSRTIYPSAGTMTATWRGVIPAGMNTTGDANCTLSIGGTDVGGPYACRSGEPFTYDVGAVANTATVTVKVEQFYYDPAITLYGFLITGSKTTTVDGQAPTASMQVLVKADLSTYAPDPMPPGQSYTQFFSVGDNVMVQGFSCALKRLTPAPVTVVASVTCPIGTGRGNFLSPNASGTYAFVVTVTDTAGNTGEGSRTFTVDATPPAVSFTAGPADGAASNGNPSWSWTSDDPNASYKCWLGAQGATPAPTTCTSPFSVSSVPNGSQQFVLVATDPLGNSSINTRNIAVDGTKPTLTLVSPSQGATITTVPFTISVDSTEGVTWNCKRDLAAWTQCGTDGSSHLNDTFTADMSSNGSHTEMIRAVDAAGNLSAPLTVNYTVAVTPAAVMQSGPTEGSSTKHPVWLWTDNLAGNTYECSMELTGTSPNYEPCSTSYTKPAGLPDGEYTFNIKATNTGYGSGTTTIHFTLDQTPPELVVESGPASGATVTSAAAKYVLSSEPGATFECLWSGPIGPPPTYKPCTSPVAVPLDTAGGNLVSFRARDVAGNVSPAVTRTVVAAIRVAPKITGTPRVGSKLTAGGTAIGGITLTYRWKRDGHSISGATKATYTPKASDRKHKITVTVTGSKSGLPSKTVTSPYVRVDYGRLTSGKARISAPSMRVKHKITASASPWTSGAKVHYQWYLGSKRIKKATKSSITLTKSMIGKRLKVKISGTKSGFHSRTVTATSGKVVR